MNETMRPTVPAAARSTRKSLATTTAISAAPAIHRDADGAAGGDHHRAQRQQRPQDRERRLHQTRMQHRLERERHVGPVVQGAQQHAVHTQTKPMMAKTTSTARRASSHQASRPCSRAD